MPKRISEKLNIVLNEAFINDENRCMKAVLQCELQTKTLENITELFNKSGVEFMPLKGALLRKYYPEPWMRECSDVDIYVKPKDFDRAEAVLTNSGYKKGVSCAHHTAFTSANGCLVELHFSPVDTEKLGKAKYILDETLIDEMFSSDSPESTAVYYLYHLYHMVNHFMDGGCGRKFFMDLWILNHSAMKEPDYEQKKTLLIRDAGLGRFEGACCALAEYWFSDECSTPQNIDLPGGMPAFDKDLADYVLSSGNFGTPEGKAAVNTLRYGSRTSYILRRLFPDRTYMENMYPILCSKPVLLPAMWIRRGFSLLSHGYLGQLNAEVRSASRLDNEFIERQRAILEKMGLE